MSDAVGAENATPTKTTRDCRDPWTYIEIMVNGDVKPCCVREPVGNLAEATLAEILWGEPIRQLRAALLTGDLDAVCAGCRQRAPIAPEAFQEKIRALREEVCLPIQFDPDAYLLANPDVAAACTTAVAHFLSYGYLEGRALQPPVAASENTIPALDDEAAMPASAIPCKQSAIRFG